MASQMAYVIKQQLAITVLKDFATELVEVAADLGQDGSQHVELSWQL